MDRTKCLEESLREASCIGDIEAVEELISKGINVNSKHALNGWTALHWAAKRSHKHIVTLLLASGADPSLPTAKGERAAELCSSPEIRQLLGADPDTAQLDAGPALPITPAYLKYEPVDKLGHKCRASGRADTAADSHLAVTSPRVMAQTSEELVIKVRVANSGDRDFIEVELPRADLTYSRLLRVCCEELGVSAGQVARVRKLPDTAVRKDKDVQRFRELQELELVLAAAGGRGAGPSVVANGLVAPGNANAYQSISLYKNQTILY
ncbi:ankyrin repeat domain-containing protein 40-like isoform X2 [Bacillus rossius redtenbacheri]